MKRWVVGASLFGLVAAGAACTVIEPVETSSSSTGGVSTTSSTSSTSTGTASSSSSGGGSDVCVFDDPNSTFDNCVFGE